MNDKEQSILGHWFFLTYLVLMISYAFIAWFMDWVIFAISLIFIFLAVAVCLTRWTRNAKLAMLVLFFIVMLSAFEAIIYGKPEPEFSRYTKMILVLFVTIAILVITWTIRRKRKDDEHKR